MPTIPQLFEQLKYIELLLRFHAEAHSDFTRNQINHFEETRHRLLKKILRRQIRGFNRG